MDGRPTPNRTAVAVQPQRAAPFGTTPSERATMARALALLFGAGGALVVLTVVLPHAANTKDAGVYATGVLAMVLSGWLVQGGHRVSVRAFQLLALGALLITSCVVFGGDNASAYPFLYLWVSLYAYYFFDARVAGALIAWCAALYALAFLAEDDPPVPGVHLSPASTATERQDAGRGAGSGASWRARSRTARTVWLLI